MEKVGKTPNYRLRWPEYAKQWDRMKVKPAVRGDLNDFVKRALAGKTRYLAVEGRTGVPWWMIAIIAERESGQNWSRSLAQGDRWDRVSRNEPRDRGPTAHLQAKFLRLKLAQQEFCNLIDYY
jgi:lysozyme family protein